MIVTVKHSNTHVELSVQEALEQIRQLAHAISSVHSGIVSASFADGATHRNFADTDYPGVISYEVHK